MKNLRAGLAALLSLLLIVLSPGIESYRLLAATFKGPNPTGPQGPSIPLHSVELPKSELPPGEIPFVAPEGTDLSAAADAFRQMAEYSEGIRPQGVPAAADQVSDKDKAEDAVTRESPMAQKAAEQAERPSDKGTSAAGEMEALKDAPAGELGGVSGRMMDGSLPAGKTQAGEFSPAAVEAFNQVGTYSEALRPAGVPEAAAPAKAAVPVWQIPAAPKEFTVSDRWISGAWMGLGASFAANWYFTGLGSAFSALLPVSLGMGLGYELTSAFRGQRIKPKALIGPAVIFGAVGAGLFFGLGLPAALTFAVGAVMGGAFAALHGRRLDKAEAKRAAARKELLAQMKPEENLAALQADVARRVAAAPEGRPRGNPDDDVVIVAGKRLPQGKWVGSFLGKEKGSSLGAKLTRKLMESLGLAASKLEEFDDTGLRVKFRTGQVNGFASPNVGRGIPDELKLTYIHGVTECANCGSGAQSVASAWDMVGNKRADIVVAGGVEVMSRFPMGIDDPLLQKLHTTLWYLKGEIPKQKWFPRFIMRFVQAKAFLGYYRRLLQLKLSFAPTDGLSINGVNMGRTAQNLADMTDTHRWAQDSFAFRSQTRALKAHQDGEYADELASFEREDGKGTVRMDQGVRSSSNRGKMGEMDTVLGTEEITAANASQISDGAGELLIMRRSVARQLGMIPLAAIRAAVDIGVEPTIMGIAPAYTLALAAKEAGIALESADIIEINEAFAAQTLAVMKVLGLDPRKVNPLGGAIAMGHPVGASGARLAVTATHWLGRHDGKVAFCTMCEGGGGGTALVLERESNGIPAEFKKAVDAGLAKRGVSAAVRQRVAWTLNGLSLFDGHPSIAGVYASSVDFLRSLGALSGADVETLLTSLRAGREVAQLPELPVYRETLSGLMAKVDFDVRLFGQERNVFKQVKFTVDEDGVATVALSGGPENSINSINMQMVAELEQVFGALAADPKVKSIVLTGEGSAFSGGADVNLLSSVTNSADAAALAEGLQKFIFSRIEQSNKPVVVAINGAAVGGGLETAMGGHKRLAVGAAQLGQPEVNLGLNPGAGGTQRLPRLVGLSLALEMMNKGKGKYLNGHAAKEARLVDDVVSDPADLLSEARRLARELGALSDKDKETFLRKNRTLKKPIRWNWAKFEPIGVYFGVGPVVGTALGIAAPFFLGAAWASLVGIAFGFGLGGLAASKFTRNPWLIRGGQLLGAAAGYFAVAFLPFWAVVAASAVFALAVSLYLVPGNGWLIKREIAAQTPEKFKSLSYVPYAIVDATLAGIKQGPRIGSQIEAKIFGGLAMRMARLGTKVYLNQSSSDLAGEPWRAIDRVAVLGAGGKMGAGITQFTVGKGGIPVTGKEYNGEAVERGKGVVRDLFDPLVKNGKIDEADLERKTGQVTWTTSFDDLVDSDPAIILEAIREVEKDKVDAFAELGRLIKAKGKNTILASNTSAISITRLAEASGMRSRFIGIHFFNPVAEMEMVEIILPNTAGWSDEEKAELKRTLATAQAWIKKLGKNHAVYEDGPGFLVNRLLSRPYIGEANVLLQEGAGIEQIDDVMKGMGAPMGPLRLADHVGMLLASEVGAYLEGALPHMGKMPRTAPRLLKWGYAGTEWGKKEGFYKYDTVKDRKTGKPRQIQGKPNAEVVELAIASERALAGVDPQVKAFQAALSGTDDAAVGAAARALHEAMEDRLEFMEAGLGSIHAEIANLRRQLNTTRSLYRGSDLAAGREPRESLHVTTLLLDSLAAAQKKFEERAASDKNYDRTEAKRMRKLLKARQRKKVSDQEIKERLMYLLVNEAARALGEGVAKSALDVDIGMLMGTGIGMGIGGLLRWADAEGLAQIAKQLSYYDAQRGGGTTYVPAPYLLELVRQGKGFYGDDQAKPAARRGSALKNLAAWLPLGAKLGVVALAYWGLSALSGKALLIALAVGLGLVLAGAVVSGVRGSGKKADSGLDKEAKSVMGMGAKQAEAVIPDFYRGTVDLSYFSKLDTSLSHEERSRLDAYNSLFQIGLRPIGLDESTERAARTLLANPTPDMRAVAAEVGVDIASLAEPLVDAHRIDKENDVPPAVLKRMNDLGLFRLKRPKEYGGMGLHLKEYGYVLRGLSNLASLKGSVAKILPAQDTRGFNYIMSSALGSLVSAYNTIGTAPLLMFGTQEQKDKYLRMNKPVSFGLTEPLAGTDVAKLDTRAVLSEDGKTWKLTGEKIFITGIMDAGMVYLVAGHTMVNGLDLGPSVMIAELPFEVDESRSEKEAKLLALDGKGMRITPFTWEEGLQLMMIRGTDQGFIQLKDFEVPAENVLGKLGQGKMVPFLALNGGRLGFVPYISETARFISDQGLRWSIGREMFDMLRPAGADRPGLQSDMESVQTTLGRGLIRSAILSDFSDLALAAADANPELSVAALSAMGKVLVSDENLAIAREMADLGGGHGLIKGSPNAMEQGQRDAVIATVVEGHNKAMAQFFHLKGGGSVAKEMKTPAGLGRFLGRQFLYQAANSVTGAAVLGGLALLAWALLAPAAPLWLWLGGGVLGAGILLGSGSFLAKGRGRGAFSRRFSNWARTRAARYALRFGVPGAILDKELGRRQNLLINAYHVPAYMLALIAVQKKLQEEGADMPEEEALARQAAVKILKAQIDEHMKYIRMSGDPIENLQSSVGRAFVKAAIEQGGPKSVDEHMKFLHDSAVSFHAGLRTRVRAQSGTLP